MKKIIRKISIMVAASILCIGSVLPVSAARESKKAVVSIELAGERNVASDSSPIEAGWAGAAIQIGDKDIIVTGVGRMYFTGANITHSFLITNDDGSIVNANPIAVQAYEDSVDGTFEYAYFDEADYITLHAGNTYYLCSDFYGPTDKFYDASAVTTEAEIRFIGKVALNSEGGWDFSEADGIDQLPVDLLYYVEGDVETPAETETPADKKTPDDTTASDNTSSIKDPVNEDKNDSMKEAEENHSSMDPWVIVLAVAVAVVIVVAIVVIVLKKKNKKDSEQEE